MKRIDHFNALLIADYASQDDVIEITKQLLDVDQDKQTFEHFKVLEIGFVDATCGGSESITEVSIRVDPETGVEIMEMVERILHKRRKELGAKH